ncbi:MAG: hypothetical protein HYV09_09555 [Deltaproteobacteria bacterium]|nr:hypothetical protein [Deltaproteobacteria bacterium]
MSGKHLFRETGIGPMQFGEVKRMVSFYRAGSHERGVMSRRAVGSLRAHAVQAMSVAVAALVAASCSSPTTTGVSCGPGTELVDGVCVPTPVESDASRVDATDSGPAVEDTLVSDTRTPEDTTTSPDVVTPKDTASETTPDVAVDTGDCAKLDINCSTTCGGPSPECALVDCGTTAWYRTSLRGPRDRIVVRLPDKPGWDPNCVTMCGGVEKKFAYVVSLEVQTDPGQYVRVTVPPDWYLSYGKCYTSTNTCAVLTTGSGPYYGSDLFLVAGTTDPLAAGGDVVIEEVLASVAKCP